MRSNLEMISNHFRVESSNESDDNQGITISNNINPSLTDTFCIEKFAHFNEIPSCVPADDPLYSSLPLFNTQDSKVGFGERLGRSKGKMKNEEIRDGNNMQKEVIHVRAKRGQATDTHSLAERARRERVNQRLKFLQELVPGCYKTMGMAVMLDVIINYIHSLHNQIEFLSMKLSVASHYYDFNDSSETDGIDMIQATNGYDNIQEVEKIVVREEEEEEEEKYGGAFYQNYTFPPNF